MDWTERLANELRLFFSFVQLLFHPLLIPGHCLICGSIRLWRIQQSVHEQLTGLVTELQSLKIPDGRGGSFLYFSDKKVCHGPPTQLRGSLNEALLILGNPSFQAFISDRCL